MCLIPSASSALLFTYIDASAQNREPAVNAARPRSEMRTHEFTEETRASQELWCQFRLSQSPSKSPTRIAPNAYYFNTALVAIYSTKGKANTFQISYLNVRTKHAKLLLTVLASVQGHII